MNRNNTTIDPVEFTEPEADRCNVCDNDILTPEEIEDEICNECFFSCCGDELNQETRICSTCKEHN